MTARPTVNPALLDQLKTLLRRDLRLGADAQIADDMPLVGGPIDLDSIDILLVVSSIEKQFQIKIPNEVVGRAAFQSVATLAHYVEQNKEHLRVDPATTGAGANNDWLSRLPHGPEFRFVSSVNDCVPGKHAAGHWHVRGDEAFLAGHFPGRPIVPGVLISEALAQLAGIASMTDGQVGGVLAAIDMRFLAPVVPPASIELRATVTGKRDRLRQVDVLASVGGQTVARGGVSIIAESK